MRLLKRPVYELIRDHFTVGGSHFSPEMMMLFLINDIRTVEIPLNYLDRIGESSVTGSRWKAFLLGIRMVTLILSYRFGSWLGSKGKANGRLPNGNGVRKRSEEHPVILPEAALTMKRNVIESS